MPIYDFECEKCGKVKEHILSVREMEQEGKLYYVTCPDQKCNGRARHIITMSGQHVGNQDASWVRTIADIIPKDATADKHDRQFLKSAMTKKDLKTWMSGKGLRHLEPGEKPRKPKPPNMERINKKLTENLIKRNRIEI